MLTFTGLKAAYMQEFLQEQLNVFSLFNFRFKMKKIKQYLLASSYNKDALKFL
jgi:hypothetical protein